VSSSLRGFDDAPGRQHLPTHSHNRSEHKNIRPACCYFRSQRSRFAIYDEAERIIVDDAPWVFLYYPITYEIQQPWVHGYVLNPMRPARLENVWLSPHAAR